MDPTYSADQLKIMRALRDNQKSMWHLAGQWYFDRPDKAFRKLKVQLIGETPMALLTAIETLTQVPQGQRLSLRQNNAAWLAASILWETLFPAKLGHLGLVEASLPLLELAGEPDRLLAAIDEFTRMPDGPGYAILYNFNSYDCVRMAQGEVGAIERFEQALEAAALQGPTP